MAVERRGRGVEVGDAEARVGRRRDRLLEHDAAAARVDDIVGVAAERALAEDEPVVAIADDEADLLRALDDAAVAQVIERAAGGAEDVHVARQAAVAGGGEQLGLLAQVHRAGVGEGLLEVDRGAVDGAVVAEQLAAAHVGLEVAHDRLRLVGLDQHVELAARLGVADLGGGVAVDRVVAGRIEGRLEELLEAGAGRGVDVRGDVVALEEVAALDAALVIEREPAVEEQVAGARGGRVGHAVELGTVGGPAALGVGGRDRAVGEHEQEVLRVGDPHRPGDLRHVLVGIDGFHQQRRVARGQRDQLVERAVGVKDDLAAVDAQLVVRVGAPGEPQVGRGELEPARR